MTRHKVFNIQV